MSSVDRGYAWALVIVVPLVVAALTVDASAAPPVTTRGQAQQPASGAGESVLDGVFTSDQAASGGQQFQQNCTACHAVSEHTGRNFSEKWNGTTLNELFELISNTMPESEPGRLKPEEYASIVAFFLKETGYPEGQRELPSDVAALAKIRVEPLAK
jgi:polar amino acid transport system substrate-binding protein